MTRRRLLLLCCVIILLVACKKEQKDPVLDQNSYASAIQLKVGNYWIYDYIEIDYSDNTVMAKNEDSVFISKDTIVNNQLYYKMGNTVGWKLVRDSAEYLVDHHGDILFSATNFVDTLYRNAGEEGRGFMTEKGRNITVPAGTFQTATYMVITDMGGHHTHSPYDPSMLGYYHMILRRQCYARSVGMVKQEIYFLGHGYILDLKRYRVN